MASRAVAAVDANWRQLHWSEHKLLQRSQGGAACSLKCFLPLPSVEVSVYVAKSQGLYRKFFATSALKEHECIGNININKVIQHKYIHSKLTIELGQWPREPTGQQSRCWRRS